jgi:hypothetical protein
MSADKRALLKQWLESGKAQLQPLTFPQRELWETSPVPVADMANHICCLIKVRGAITPEDAERAVGRVVERQEALRISFLPGKDRPVQMVRDKGDTSFRFREVPAAQDTPEHIEELANDVFRQRFDLVQGPLYRVELLRRAPDDHVLVFAIHHAIADGWTLGVFIQDLCVAYLQGLRGILDPLPAPQLGYTAWGATERGYWQPAKLAQYAEFWKSALEGRQRLWSKIEGPATASGPLRRMVSYFPQDLADAVRELARRSGATLFNTLLSAFQITLSRWTGANDILVGTPVANRTRQAVRETMGYCSGVVPIRGQVDPDRTFTASLKAVQENTVDCFANAMPFAELAQALGDTATPGHAPIFEVRFALQNHPIPDVSLPGLSAKLKMRSTGTARFHLACEITEEGEQLEVVWLFRPNLFPQAEIEDLGRMFQAVVAGACRAPESRISTITI